jgi:hypothetical protein
MTQKMNLDVDSFQKLLEAVWVLQSQRAAGLRGLSAGRTAPANREVERPIPAASINRAADRSIPVPQVPQICIAIPTATRGRAELMAAYAKTAGALALAENPVRTTEREVIEFPAPAEVKLSESAEVESAPAEVSKKTLIEAVENIPVQGTEETLPVLNLDESLPAVVEQQPSAADAGGQGRIFSPARLLWDQLMRGRARIRYQPILFRWRPGTGQVYALSLVVLLIVGNFLFSLLARSQPNLRPQISGNSAEVWHDHVASNAVHPAVQKVEPRVDPPALESSHLHITDDAVSAAVDELSRYEVKNLRRQAQYGDHVAALTLGMAYEVGGGVRQNCSDAARWITRAAEEGSAAAQYTLALRYHDGDGTPVDLEESRKWMSKAASRGYEKARAALAALAPANPASAGGQ